MRKWCSRTRSPHTKVGGHRLYVCVWKHRLSIYEWEKDRAAGFTARHPELVTSKGTIELRPRTPNASATTN